MPTTVKLLGLDFGSTTCSAVLATAHLLENRLTGRRELTAVTPTYRSELVFTPFVGESIDLAAATQLLDGWLHAGAARPAELFGGGALITGLCAEKENAARLAELVRSRVGDAVIATADDPQLESFVAFMGSAAALSQAEPQTPLLSLDLGGGTTNLALGLGGEVRRTGCLRIGARHLRFRPGTAELCGYSALGRRLLDHLGIAKPLGAALAPRELAAVLDSYVEILEAACTGRRAALDTPLGRALEAVPLELPAGLAPPTLVFAGGVGALIHTLLQAQRQGLAAPQTPCYGDLGLHLAERIVQSPLLRGPVVTCENAGRATVLGLLTGCTQVSGASLYLPQPHSLPLRDLPIFGELTQRASATELQDALQLVRSSPRGGALRVHLQHTEPAALRDFGARVQALLQALAFPPAHPVVLLLAQNLGKALGGYITGWRPPSVNLIVIDELARSQGRFVHLGPLREQVVPVSFYGLEQ